MKEKCRCPFCDHELVFSCFEPVFCKNCKVRLVACGKCGKLYNETMARCPHCATENRIKVKGRKK
ncbi:MAG TPA: hypothetical protein VF399_06775 [bacterium]